MTYIYSNWTPGLLCRATLHIKKWTWEERTETALHKCSLCVFRQTSKIHRKVHLNSFAGFQLATLLRDSGTDVFISLTLHVYMEAIFHIFEKPNISTENPRFSIEKPSFLMWNSDLDRIITYIKLRNQLFQSLYRITKFFNRKTWFFHQTTKNHMFMSSGRNKCRLHRT